MAEQDTYTVAVAVVIVNRRTGHTVQHTEQGASSADVPLWYAVGDAAEAARNVAVSATRKGEGRPDPNALCDRCSIARWIHRDSSAQTFDHTFTTGDRS